MNGLTLCKKIKTMNRRELIIERMEELERSGLNCKNCSGTCCTFEANSMLITPLEAVEIFHYLKAQKQLTDELKRKLQKVIKQYRLEPKFDHQKRSYLRKTYTCPFFNHHELGCPLPREIKPYGCLAFNAHHQELKAGEFCYSENDLLMKREFMNGHEVDLNKKIKEEFLLYWEKSPIPNALLEIWEKTTDF